MSQTDKHKWAMKAFDLAENPIKEWIAQYLEEEVHTVFDDYNDYADILNIQINDKNCSLYLTSYPEIKNTFQLNLSEYSHSEDLKSAIDILYNAVYTVYLAIIKTMAIDKNKLENIIPKFDRTNMYFNLFMINPFAIKKSQIQQNLIKIHQELKKLNQANDEQKKSNEFLRIQKQLIDLQNEQLNQDAQITQSQIDDFQKICDRTNIKLQNCAKLYLCLEIDKQDIPEELMIKRLPLFGCQYQDPD